MSNPQFSKADIDRLKGPALRAFVNLSREWQLDADGQKRILGHVDDELLAQWRAGQYERVTAETMTRLSLLLGIYKASRMITTSHEHACRWINRPFPHAPCFGKSPLEFAASGRIEDLWTLRRWLDRLW